MLLLMLLISTLLWMWLLLWWWRIPPVPCGFGHHGGALAIVKKLAHTARNAPFLAAKFIAHVIGKEIQDTFPAQVRVSVFSPPRQNDWIRQYDRVQRNSALQIAQ